MRNNIILLILSGLFLLCSGCRTSADFNYIEDSIRDQISPAKMDKDFKFSIGSLSMGMLKGLVDDEEAEICLKEIEGVQVGVYKIRDMEKSTSFHIPSNVEKRMIKNGWELFVRVHNRKKENVSLYYRQLSENTVSIYAIVLEPDELVIAEISGKLDNILDKAICEHRLTGMENI